MTRDYFSRTKIQSTPAPQPPAPQPNPEPVVIKDIEPDLPIDTAPDDSSLIDLQTRQDDIVNAVIDLDMRVSQMEARPQPSARPVPNPRLAQAAQEIRPKQSVWPVIAIVVLMLVIITLAAVLALQVTGVFGPKPNPAPDGPETEIIDDGPSMLTGEQLAYTKYEEERKQVLAQLAAEVKKRIKANEFEDLAALQKFHQTNKDRLLTESFDKHIKQYISPLNGENYDPDRAYKLFDAQQKVYQK